MASLTRNQRRLKLFEQRIMGIILLVLMVGVMILAKTGFTDDGQEGAIVVLLLPLSLGLIFSKHIWIV